MHVTRFVLCACLVFTMLLVADALGKPQQAPQITAEQSQAQTNNQRPSPQPGDATPKNSENEITTRNTDAQIKVHVNLVLVRAVVRNAAGKEVAGLKKEDFRLLDNGKEQKITMFNVETAETKRTDAAAIMAEATAGNSIAEDAPEQGTQPSSDVRSASSAVPQRFVVLVFDDLHMKANESLAVRAASEKLFTNLAPMDRVAIYTTSGEGQQDFTGDAEILRKTLAKIVPRVGKGEDEFECPTITYYMADLIYNKHDAEALKAALQESQANNCLLTATDILANAERILQVGDQNTRIAYQSLGNVVKRLTITPGQRVLVYVSPGFILTDDIQSVATDLIDRAMRAGVVVNVIDAKALYTADQLPDIAASPKQPTEVYGPQNAQGPAEFDWQGIEGTYRMQAQFEQGSVLAGMAASTGGTYFHNRNDLDVGMNQALSAPGISYLLGFSPQNLKVDGKFHKLTVTIENGQKYQIQARNGYYAPKALADAEEMVKQEVRDALFSQDEIVDMPVTLNTQFFKMDAESTQLTVFTHMDIKGMHFRKADGRNYNNVVLATAVFDNDGQFVEGQMREITLKLLDSSFQRLSTSGLTLKMSFAVKPGTYLLRCVLSASEGEQLTARNATTVIP